MWTAEALPGVAAGGAVVGLSSFDRALSGGYASLILNCLGLSREAERAVVS